MNKTRVFSLLLALVVLISCLPVIPAAADEIYWLDGTWEFKYDISWPSDFDFFYPSFVTIDGTPFDAFNYIYSESELWLYNQGEDACAYDSGSWSGALPVVSFSERVQVTKDEYDFFQTNLTQTSSPSATCSTTLNIDGQLFTFLGTGSSPLVQMTVNIDGCTLTDGSSSRQFVYSGSGTFKGFSISSGGSLNYSIGSTWTFGGKSGVDSSYSLFSAVSSVGYVVKAGQWEANKSLASATNEYLSLSDWPEGLNPVALSFISNGQNFYTMSYQNTIVYGHCLFYGDTCVYGYDTLAAISDPGWKMDSYALVYLATDQSVPEEFYTWFTSNFTYVGSDSQPVYSSSITINGVTVTFTSNGSAPKISMQVLDTGAVFTAAGKTVPYVYEGVGSFLGFAVTASGEPFFIPGNTYTLDAGHYIFYSVGDSAGSAAVSVVVDDETFTFSADEFPVYITVTVTESGCHLTDGERVLTYTYSGEGVFSGLTFESGSDPVYVVGDEISVQFRDATNSTYTLYSCFDLEGEGVSGILEVLKNLYKKFVGWIDGSISLPEITVSLNIVDFGSIKSFFVDAYQGLTSLFGLRDLMEDPAGPFAWLLE